MVEENGVTKFRQEGHEKEKKKRLLDMIATKESSNQSMLLSR